MQNITLTMVKVLYFDILDLFIYITFRAKKKFEVKISTVLGFKPPIKKVGLCYNLPCLRNSSTKLYMIYTNLILLKCKNCGLNKSIGIF